MSTNITSSAIAFVLTKRLVVKTKANLVIITFWIYFFGFLNTFILFLIQASTDPTTSISNELLNVFFQDTEIFGVLLFSCFNEIFNYMLIIYLMRKSYVSKAAVYGLMSAIFIMLDGLFFGKIDYI
jgi:hypothetical protein